eukprot:CAMPEP_0116015930 /NCGR_PEP_ID=MMETSP0321-20121206/7155_1 /TAXON_ID=163516 /ORGANISM="Leptocylindrus danicus var. danicus, Strain B650" /LENGTH=64 /DNA_ID=CAMNT_0003485845 /DNA_START=541 /DNA_END=731 /DNA_ORIENTATION=-
MTFDTYSGVAPFSVLASLLLYFSPSPVMADRLKFVFIYPGDTMCTDTPADASSARKDSQYPCTA